MRELSKNIDANYLGLATVKDGTEAARELQKLEEIEALAEDEMRSG